MTLREIIFRGKLPSGAWVYGDLRQYPCGAKAIKSTDFTSLMEVDPRTVGQYTGLTDKNGTKIFEGDIVHMNSKKFGLSGHGLVVFRNGGFAIDDRKRKRLYPFMQNGQYNAGDYRVDCNIYDTPELLEVRNG